VRPLATREEQELRDFNGQTVREFATEAAACRAAHREWSTRSVSARLASLRELRHLLVEHADAISDAVHADIGRPVVDVVGTELLPTAAAIKYLEKEAERILAPRRIARRLRPLWLWGCRDAVHHRPWGVVGIIGTWNYPVYLNVVQIAQAVAAGNGVLWKPSENAPRTADLTHQLLLKAGLLPNLVVKLPATREGGAQLAEADIDHVVFTGSDRVGRMLAARLGERLIPSTLELSGIDAMFVLEDADVALAAQAAWFALTLNRGQTCIAVRRIFVHRTVLPAFVDALKPLAEAAGPVNLVTPGQVAQATKLIENAVAAGGSHLAGSGEAIRPTVLLDAPASAAIFREACFAPIAGVVPFDSIDTALSLAAESPFGLSCSIFTKNAGAAETLAARIPAGSVVINDVIAPTAHPATPFGGRGASGWGVTQGEEGLLAMTVPQVVTVRSGRFRPHFEEAVTPDPATLAVLQGLLQASHGRGFARRLAGWWKLLSAMRRKGTNAVADASGS
jgi:acyl-CoA reductase-like NAD-dependent aldehyde dehydrogenase